MNIYTAVSYTHLLYSVILLFRIFMPVWQGQGSQPDNPIPAGDAEFHLLPDGQRAAAPSQVYVVAQIGSVTAYAGGHTASVYKNQLHHPLAHRLPDGQIKKPSLL